MNFIDPAIEEYALSHSEAETAILKKVNRDTHAKVMMPRMLSGPMQGNLLKMFSCMIQPKQILEIGTYTGYSAICLAHGLQHEGMLHTIDINEELEGMVRKNFDDAGLTNKVSYYLGNALKIIPTIKQHFDLVFIDADKKNYAAYYDLIFDRVNIGGYIIADNVLWSGKVVNTEGKMDNDTQAIDSFNKKVSNDTRVEKMLLPVRDGLMIARRII
jgi:caffeoyl-CoA O-methyltransferase